MLALFPLSNLLSRLHVPGSSKSTILKAWGQIPPVIVVGKVPRKVSVFSSSLKSPQWSFVANQNESSTALKKIVVSTRQKENCYLIEICQHLDLSTLNGASPLSNLLSWLHVRFQEAQMINNFESLRPNSTNSTCSGSWNVRRGVFFLLKAPTVILCS